MSKFVWVTHPSGWEIEVTEEVANDPERLAKVMQLLKKISET